MSMIAIICGLKSEEAAVRAALSDKVRVQIYVSGANAARAYFYADEACANGASAILSIGISGGLDPALNAGDLIVGDDVLTESGERFQADQKLCEAVGEFGFRNGAVFGSDSIIQSADAKSSLFARTNCLAVDMESHGAARAARKTNTPFIAIRAIADPSSRALPVAALGAVADDGSTKVFQTLSAALRDPKQFPALIKLGADSAAATKTLRTALGPLLQKITDV